MAAYPVPKFCNRLAVQHDRVVVIDCGHAVAMHASRYHRLVDKHDFCGPKHLERVERLDDSGAFGFAGDPRPIFLGIHAAPLDDAEADVINVAVGHHVSHAAGIRRTSEKVEGKGVKPIGRMPDASWRPCVACLHCSPRPLSCRNV